MWREHNIVYVHIIHSYSHIIRNPWASWANGYYLTSIITLSAFVVYCYVYVARTFYTLMYICYFFHEQVHDARARACARCTRISRCQCKIKRTTMLHICRLLPQLPLDSTPYDLSAYSNACSVHLELKCKKNNNNNNKITHTNVQHGTTDGRELPNNKYSN